MPAFVRPLRALVERGHHITIIAVAPDLPEEATISADWLKKTSITFVTWDIRTPLAALGAITRLFRLILRETRKTKPDFVYGHGSLGTVALLAAILTGVPAAIRLYGTFLAEEITQRLGGKIRTFTKHPLEYLAYTLPKRFLLMTNDGTRGDKVFQWLGNDRSTFLFWTNGIDLPASTGDGAVSCYPRPFALYPARVARWKQQHLALELVAILKDKYGISLDILFAGHVSEDEYHEELQEQIRRDGLGDQVKFLGAVGPETLSMLYRQALCVLSFYRASNLGNVAIETLASGGVLIALDDGSLNACVENEVSGFLVPDMNGAAKVVSELSENAEVGVRVGKAAQRAAVGYFLPWKERVEREVELIESFSVRQ